MVVMVSSKMRKHSSDRANQLFGSLSGFLRRCIFRVLSVGPVPDHFAFIMDGNRRYAKKQSLEEGSGHKAGFSALMSILNYCYELGVKYVTVYAFSIDNFKRRPEEVQSLMDLMLEKIEALLQEESIVNEYGIRVYFIGNLKLLSEPVRAAAEKVMMVTANNSKATLLVCVAYTSSDEIVHAVQESCKNKWDEIQALNPHKYSNGIIKELEKGGSVMPGITESYKDVCSASQALSMACDSLAEGLEVIEMNDGPIPQTINQSCEDECDEIQGSKAGKVSNGGIRGLQVIKMQEQHPIMNLVDIEKHMYMAVAPDPDVLIRSSGETRLSNFLLWQTSTCPLYSPAALWPEIGFWHFVWTVLNFQRSYSYFEKKKKQL